MAQGFANPPLQDTNLTKVGGATFALGQQLDTGSLPVVLTAAQITTLTPTPAITNYALETGGNLANIYTRLADGNQKTQIVDGSGNVVGTDSHNGMIHLLTDTDDTSLVDTISGAGDSAECVMHGMGSGLVLVGGTWQGKIDIQGAIDSTWVTLSIFQPTGQLIRTGINNDAQNGMYRIVIVTGYTKIRAVFTTWTSGTATIQFNFSQPVGSSQVWQLNPLNLYSTVSQATGTNLHAVVDSGSVTVNTISNFALESGGNLATLAGGVTGSKYQIRNLTSASDSVEVKQATGTNLHAVVDSGSVTVNTISNFALESGGNLATLAGGVTGSKYQIRNLTSASDSVEVKQATGTNLHAVIDSGTVATTTADGANVTMGAKADAKSTATDTTAVSMMQVLKEISYMEQNPAKRVIDFDPANESAFGTLEVGELSPVIQGDFVYGLNTQIWATPVVSGTGATIDTNLSRLRVQSGTNSAGYAYIQSRRNVRYRAGQGSILRFTPVFSAGIANNIQIVGIGSIVSNLPFDGYFFGYNGTAFGIFHYNGSSTPTFYSQASDWNGDKVDGTAGTSFTLDPTKGTPMMIKYPFLGYGDIFFYIEHPTTGAWVLVHTIRYANTTATVQLTNPALFFTAFTLNSGNTTNKTMYCGSYGAFVSGLRTFIGNPKWAADSTKTGITTEAVALSLRNCTTYNGVTNRGLLRLHSVSFGTNTNTYGQIRFKINATIGGAPSFAAVNGTTADNGVTITAGNSLASVDVAGTTVTGGTYIWNAAVGSQGIIHIDLTPYEIFVAPSEILTVSLFAAANLAAAVSINWSEDV